MWWILLACSSPLPDLAMVELPAGTYRRGTTGAPNGEVPATPSKVRITHRTAIGRTEVTQALWRAVMDEEPWRTEHRFGDGRDQGPCDVGERGDDMPAYCVSWLEAVTFANRVSEHEGLQPAYRIEGDQVRWDRAADGYRLPTEAEWAWAAGGVQQLRYGVTSRPDDLCGLANVADARWHARQTARKPEWSCDDGHAGLAPVASYPPNARGLHDTTGNVWEWTWDRFGPWPDAVLIDPAGPPLGSHRVARGAGYSSTRAHTMLDARIHGTPDTRGLRLGLRLARTLPE